MKAFFPDNTCCTPTFGEGRLGGVRPEPDIRDNASEDRDVVKAKLLSLKPALKAAGVVHLHLHGSVVRGDATPDSDVDVAAQFDKTKRLSLIDLVGLQIMMSDTLWL